MMRYTDKRIIAAYADLFEGLSNDSKIELIETLSSSLKTQHKEKIDKFYKSFGAFGSKQSTESIVAEIKSSRKFRNREINW